MKDLMPTVCVIIRIEPGSQPQANIKNMGCEFIRCLTGHKSYQCGSLDGVIDYLFAKNQGTLSLYRI